MTLGPVVQRLLALAILSGLAFAVWAGGLVPLKKRLDEYHAAEAQSAELIARYRAVLAGIPALEAETARLRDHPALKKGLVKASSPELAAAALQGKVKASSATGGAKLISMQVLSAKDDAGFTRIGVRARLSGTVEALQSVFYELQTAWPALIVDNVNVRARIRHQRRKRGTPPALTVDPALAIRFDAFGYMESQHEAAPAAATGADK